MSDQLEKISKQGGFRPGAGRPSLGKKAKDKTISICGSQYEVDTLKAKAKSKKKTVSRFVFEELVEQPND